MTGKKYGALMPIVTEDAQNASEIRPRQTPEAFRTEGYGGFDGMNLIEYIYAIYSPRLYYLCLRMTGNPDDAEDLSQEAFLRVIQKLDSYRGESALYTWLRRLTINVVLLRFQKASWRREVSLEELTASSPLFGGHPREEFSRDDPELAGAVDRVLLERAIDRLPAGFKAVFVLHDIEGYDHSEISRLMGCSIGTSKSQLHKARLKLREFLSETRHDDAGKSQRRNNLKARQTPPQPHAARAAVLEFPRPYAPEYVPPISRIA
jgi:RNA polymerase sigma-70 factor, ECF subfamily